MAETLPPQNEVNGGVISGDLSQGGCYIDGMETSPQRITQR